MNFSLAGILDEAKNKAVQEATEKFGPSATPTAEEVAGKAEEMLAARMGVSVNQPTASGGQSVSPNANAAPASGSAPEK